MHSKSDIKEWMKENGKTCKWLSEQCGVSIHTAYGWMSVRREIPSKSLVRIRELMGEAAPSLGAVKGTKAGSLKALQLENTILNPGETLDLDEWVRSSVGNK